MRVKAGLVLAFLLISSASAQASEGSLADRAGDAADPFDIRAVEWRHASSARVAVQLAAAPHAEGGYTAVLFAGMVGSAEPTRWYVLHSGPGGNRALAGHTGEDAGGNASRNDDGVTWRFSGDDAGGSDCTFAVARSVTYETSGQVVHDVAGWSDAAIEEAWDAGRACVDGPPPDAHLDAVDPESAGVPAPGIAVVAAALWLARRTQS